MLVDLAAEVAEIAGMAARHMPAAVVAAAVVHQMPSGQIVGSYLQRRLVGLLVQDSQVVELGILPEHRTVADRIEQVVLAPGRHSLVVDMLAAHIPAVGTQVVDNPSEAAEASHNLPQAQR